MFALEQIEGVNRSDDRATFGTATYVHKVLLLEVGRFVRQILRIEPFEQRMIQTKSKASRTRGICKGTYTKREEENDRNRNATQSPNLN